MYWCSPCQHVAVASCGRYVPLQCKAPLGVCSFQEFFKKGTEPSQGETGSAGQQEPAVIVLLPLLLGLGKVSLFAPGVAQHVMSQGCPGSGQGHPANKPRVYVVHCQYAVIQAEQCPAAALHGNMIFKNLAAAAWHHAACIAACVGCVCVDCADNGYHVCMHNRHWSFQIA